MVGIEHKVFIFMLLCRPYTSVNLKEIQINGFTGTPFVKSLGSYVDTCRNLDWDGREVGLFLGSGLKDLNEQ